MALYAFAFFLGAVAGLRTMIAPAALAWAVHLGGLDLTGTHFGFLGAALTPWLLSALAAIELVVDQLPATPSRTRLVPLAVRLVSGGFCGVVIGTAGGLPWGSLGAGLIGAGLGTFGGAALRARLAARFGRDRPAALIEDAVAIGSAVPLLRALT